MPHNWLNENPGMRCSVCQLGWWGDTSERNLPECGSDEAFEQAHRQLTIGRQKDEEALRKATLDQFTEKRESNNLSSGRWDAVGSWEKAVQAQMDEAMRWANDLDDLDLADILEAMVDSNEFTTYERRAVLLASARTIRRSGPYPSNCVDAGCKKCLPDDPSTWNHCNCKTGCKSWTCDK